MWKTVKDFAIVGGLAFIIYWQQVHSYGALMRNAEARGVHHDQFDGITPAPLRPLDSTVAGDAGESDAAVFSLLNINGPGRKHIVCSLSGLSGNSSARVEGTLYRNRIRALAGKNWAFQLEDPAHEDKPGRGYVTSGQCVIDFVVVETPAKR